MLFSRYMFSQALAALLLILMALSAVLWIALALKSLNVVTGQGQTTWTLIRMTFLALPNLLTVIAPVALLIATVQTLNRANGDSELIVMTASGATIWTIARPFFALATIVALAVAIGTMLVNPWSSLALQRQVAEVRTDLISQVMKPGEFSSPEEGLTFHIRGRGRDETIAGLMIRDTREPDVTMTYLAERARFQKEDGRPYLVMVNGHIIRKLSDKAAPQLIGFASYAFDIDRMAQKSDTVFIKPRARTMGELLNPDPNEPYFKRWPGRYRAELHERIVAVLYPFVFVVIVLSQLGHAQTTRQGRIAQISTAVVAAVLIRLAGLAMNKLVVKHAWATPLLYLVPLAALAWCLWLMHARMRPNTGGPEWVERLGATAKRLAGGLRAHRRGSRARSEATG
ncbi:MAG: LPS export ABC transporter permease LptF [Pseudomonadota bacterium]